MSWWRKLLERAPKQADLEGQLIKLSPKAGDVIIFRVRDTLDYSRGMNMKAKLVELIGNQEVKVTLMHNTVDVFHNGEEL